MEKPAQALDRRILALRAKIDIHPARIFADRLIDATSQRATVRTKVRSKTWVIVEIGPTDFGEVSNVLRNYVNKLRFGNIRYVGIDPFFDRDPEARLKEFKRSARQGVNVEFRRHSILDGIPFGRSSVDEIHAHAIVIWKGGRRHRYVGSGRIQRRIAEKFLQEAKNALKKGGKLFISGNGEYTCAVHDFYYLISRDDDWYRDHGFRLVQRGGREEAAVFSSYGPKHLVVLEKL